MKKNSSYPFYKSIRFRFGLLFNFLLLVFLSAIIFLLYGNVQHELKKNFLQRLLSGANIILQKTEVNPLTIPLPQSNEYFLLTYNNQIHTDTMFNSLTEKNVSGKDSIHENKNWWYVSTLKTLETGGVINIIYALPATEYNAAIQQLSILLFIYIPVAIIISFVAGYFLSGVFLKPLNNIISKANQTDLTNNIKLLNTPDVKDELHELVEALNRMLARIEKQSQQQNAFFASASHELRTPLSNMLIELQTMNLNDVSPTMQSVIQNQIAEVQRLKQLVNNFLLMSQLKAESITVHKINFNIADVCVEMIEVMQTSFKENKNHFKINMNPPDEDFTIHADKNHFSIVLNNLMSNALKYNEGDATIHISITKNIEYISFIIQNNTAQQIDDVTPLKNEFMRGGFLKEGCGLGLWITERLLQKNDGELKLSYDNSVFCAKVKMKIKSD